MIVLPRIVIAVGDVYKRHGVVSLNRIVSGNDHSVLATLHWMVHGTTDVNNQTCERSSHNGNNNINNVATISLHNL